MHIKHMINFLTAQNTKIVKKNKKKSWKNQRTFTNPSKRFLLNLGSFAQYLIKLWQKV